MHSHREWMGSLRLESILRNAWLVVLTALPLCLAASATPPRKSARSQASGRRAVPVRHPRGLLTASDFTFLGAFRLPGGSNGSSFSYGGNALAFRFDGDAQGPPDGFPGSLFVVGHAYQQTVAEISIPVPLDPRMVGLDGLNVARTLQGFTDITEGLAPALDEGNGFLVDGLAYLPAQAGQSSGKLYWTARPFYNVDDSNDLSHGMSNVDFTHLESRGLWRLGAVHSQMTAGYLLTIPAYFAEPHLGGDSLACGLFTHQGISLTSAGPALFAFAPYSEPDLGPGAQLSVQPLMYYACNPNGFGCDSALNDYRDTDAFDGAAWVDVPNAHALVVVGRRGATNRYETGNPAHGDCNDWRGYHGEPYSPSILFYDPGEIASVADGDRNPTGLQPYAEWNPAEFMEPTCEWALADVDYDRENHLLYIMQREVDQGAKPLIYVFWVFGPGRGG